MDTTMVAYLQSQGSWGLYSFQGLGFKGFRVCLEGHVDLVSSTWASRDPSMAHGAVNVLTASHQLRKYNPYNCRSLGLYVRVCVYGDGTPRSRTLRLSVAANDSILNPKPRGCQ